MWCCRGPLLPPLCRRCPTATLPRPSQVGAIFAYGVWGLSWASFLIALGGVAGMQVCELRPCKQLRRTWRRRSAHKSARRQP